MTSNSFPVDVAFFAPYTEHVGTEGAMINIASYFEANGCGVELLRMHEEWPETSDPPGTVVSLDTSASKVFVERLPPPLSKFFLAGVSLKRLSDYLDRATPDVLIVGLLSAMGPTARVLANTDTKVVVTIQGLPMNDRIRRWLWPKTYPRADAVVAPATGVKERAQEILGSAAEDCRIDVIPNPVITEEVIERGKEPPDHPWFQDDIPVIVAVGRQTWQKDFETLLRSFAELRSEREVRLIVPGKESEKTAELRELQQELGITDSVDFPGFVDNPYAYMARADVFVLSSRFEGPGHVLIEALAVGTAAVATDCPAGPREILNNGDAGELVPAGESKAMADAIRRLLDNPRLRQQYINEGKRAIEPYRVSNASAQYFELCRRLITS